MKPVLLCLICCVVGLGQSLQPPTPAPYLELKQYLSLTDSQYQSFLANLNTYNTIVQNKQRRVNQVSAEIAEETARENLDAMALGVRYLELEVNCREMTAAFAALRTQNLALLNDAQKTKVKTLEDTLKLSNVIQQAQQVNLLPSDISFPSNSLSFASFLLGTPSVFGASYPGCRAPSVIPANRITGVFLP